MHARAWVFGVWAAILLWSVALFLVVRDHFLNFRLGRYDLGNMVQAVWNTADGRPLESTNGATGEQMTRLGSHVDPILAALAPLWLVAPTPLTLIAVQVGAVALGALPVFWLARRHLESERVAAILAAGYLAYPWVAWTAVDVFHPVTLAIPLLLFCAWFLDSDRLIPFAVCAVLAAMCGELMAVGVAGLGVWYALARGRRRAGIAIVCAGIGWVVLAFSVVVPAFSQGSSVFYGAYDEVGGSPLGILRKAVTDPLTVATAVASWSDALYLFLLAAPLGGLFILAPGLAAVALPQLSANLLASWDATTDPRAHYVAGVLPFLIAAVAVGLSRLSPEGRIRGALLVLTLSVVSAVMVGPWPGAVTGAPTFYRTNASPEFLGALRAAVALIPDDEPVTATNRLGSHLAARRYLYSAPVLGSAKWAALDMSDTWVPAVWGGGSDPEAILAFRLRLAQSPDWHLVLDQGGVVVFQKVG
ncbi:MAG TPA: DUF2079 domain-containing protein [Gaiellaceae bacterium]|nr:DUF2079 domain-containing protein [Gaiellaceae bacterium]